MKFTGYIAKMLEFMFTKFYLNKSEINK